MMYRVKIPKTVHQEIERLPGNIRQRAKNLCWVDLERNEARAGLRPGSCLILSSLGSLIPV